MAIFFLLLIPILVYGGLYLYTPETVTWKEFLAALVVTCAVMAGGYFGAKYWSMTDIEHWNGRITAKNHDTIGCCHCHTVCDARDKKGSCTSSHEECSHSWDHEWSLSTNIDKRIVIETCQGWKSEPAAWTEAYVKEPVAVENRYVNYLKADPDSLMTPAAEAYVDKVLEFPDVFAHYKVDRVISDGVPIPHTWQNDLDELNADLGPQYQIDLLVYLTTAPSPEFAQAVKAKWLYGPKNAVTIVLGAPDGKTIKWARVVTLSDVPTFKIEIRDGLAGKSLQDPDIIPFVAKEVKTQYIRTPMAEYEYLASAVRIPTWLLVILIIGDVFICLGLALYMHFRDVFGDESYINRTRLRSDYRRPW